MLSGLPIDCDGISLAVSNSHASLFYGGVRKPCWSAMRDQTDLRTLGLIAAFEVGLPLEALQNAIVAHIRIAHIATIRSIKVRSVSGTRGINP